MSVIAILNRLGCAIVHRQNAALSYLPICNKFKYFSNKPTEPIIVEGVPANSIPQKKTKRPIVPKITLISGKDDVTVTTLEDAQKMANRRNLKLVKIVDLDTKTERPLYKLMTAAEYAAEDVKHKKDRKNATTYKGEKVLMLSTVITDHDLKTHIRKIEKWVAKEYEVRVAISATSGNLDKSVNNFYRNI